MLTANFAHYKTRAALALWMLLTARCASAQFNLPVPETPLLGASVSGNTAAVKELLRGGANPNQGRFLGLPAVMYPLMMQNRDMFQAFVDAKADLNVRDQSGSTTLMWAVYNEKPSPEIIRQILKAGVDLNARDDRGDTALVWAMRRGNTAAVQMLEQAGASRDPQIREAVQKSLALLQKSGPQFVRVSGCVSCHHQFLPLMAMDVARRRGIAFSEADAAKDVEAIAAFWKNTREYMTMDSHKIPNPPIVVSFSLVALAAAKYPANETTEAMSRFVAQHQQKDGSWRSDIKRPPMEASDFTATALSLRSLQLYGKDQTGVARAAQWLAAQQPHSVEDASMQLLGLSWAEADRTLIEQNARKLLARQQPGGGWSQLDTPEPDAYATGQALYALHTAGALKTTDAAYRKGVDYLLRTRLADGSWLVVSRSFPLQPYKESGFPHGKDQWISAAGTSWAALALGLAAGNAAP